MQHATSCGNKKRHSPNKTQVGALNRSGRPHGAPKRAAKPTAAHDFGRVPAAVAVRLEWTYNIHMDTDFEQIAETAVEAVETSASTSEVVAPAAGAIPYDVDGDQEPSAAERVAKTAGKVALSAMVATSLVNALSEPPRTDLITLPEPTPIVQVYSPYVDDIEPAEDEDDDENDHWRKILKILKYLAVALLLAGAVTLGALKGCAGCSAALLLPNGEQEQPQQGEPADQSREDEAQELPAAA